MNKNIVFRTNPVSRLCMAFLLVFALFSTGALSACSSEASEEAATNAEQLAAIDVTLKLMANEEAGLEAQEIALSVPEGATVYEVLLESGLEHRASDSEYGKFVESIAGIDNTDTTGWVYTVNGEEVVEGCDSFVLSANDVVEWSLVSW